MKLLLVCDDTIISCEGKYYFPSQERYDFYCRYLRVFEELRLGARVEYQQKLNQAWIPITCESRLEYYPLPSFHGPKEYLRQYLATGKIMRHIVDGCDAAVLRLPSTVAQRAYRQVRKAGIPYAVEVVFDSYDGYKSATKLSLRIIYYIIYRQLVDACRNADGVSCVTEHYLQRRYFSTKPNAFTSHYSSLALDKSFYGAARTFPQKKEFVIAHTAKQVMFKGRKGHNELIQAAKLLKDQGIYVQVHFAGNDYNDGIRQLTEFAESLGVAEQIHFVGFLNRSELSDFLDKSDLYVLPTKAEGLPRVIIEAMAKGLPCITTPVSGNPELLPEHFLVDYDDVQTLANRIAELVTSEQCYEKASLDNFQQSRKYEASLLQKRRDEFYTELKSRKK